MLQNNLVIQFLMLIKKLSDIYKNDKSCYKKIKKKFPKFIKSKSLKKNELGSVIKDQIKKILKKYQILFIPSLERECKIFFKKNKRKKMVVLDIPLLVENKLYDKNFYLIFVQSKKMRLIKDLKKGLFTIKNYYQSKKIPKIFDL